MPLTQYMAKQLLDWMLGGASATQPTARFLQYASGSPNVSGASDAPITSRMSIVMGSANSPQGSATVLSSQLNATATAAAPCVGWNLYDAAAGGNRLMFGTLSAAFSATSGSNIRMSSGSRGLQITLT